MTLETALRSIPNKAGATVSCVVYRGTMRYYVEVGINNKGNETILLPADFVSFSKPGYTAYRTSTIDAARDVAAQAGIEFVPTPPPIVRNDDNNRCNSEVYRLPADPDYRHSDN